MALAALALALVVTHARTAQEGWDALAAEYEQAYQRWASELSRSGGWQKPQEERAPSPVRDLWPRFEALSAAGDGRATVWLLQALDEFGSEGERAARAAPLLERVCAAGAEQWVARALPELVLPANGLAPASLGELVDALARGATVPALRVAVLCARAALAGEPARAEELVLHAAVLRWLGVELGAEERVEGELVDELARALLDGLRDSDWFEQNLYEGPDGIYYPHALFDADPGKTWRPALEALASRGNAGARVWVLTNTYGSDEAKKTAMREHLEALTHAELAPEQRQQLLWYVDSWMQTLGAEFVEPRMRAIAAKGGDEEQARLLFGLGVGRCETARDDAEREVGLALLREIGERWPKSETAKDAAGKLFRFTNLVVGKPAPDFDTVDVDGNAFRLSDYKGKVTVIDFWGFW